MKTSTSEGKREIHIIDERSGSGVDVKARIGKSRTAYLQLKNIRNSKQLSTNTKVKIPNTNFKTVLMYGAETWKTTKTIIQNIQNQWIVYIDIDDDEDDADNNRKSTSEQFNK
ncbi:unnamed protein product [Schistosoma margrebowiei]|uniref:Uncharacterized protein n=1 Tax=Schistosoma margrebowiei TaxID=48269 RepID=A0A183MWE5_9TREM|nr:unnamed protein product [Schistosoma margrebowiei]